MNRWDARTGSSLLTTDGDSRLGSSLSGLLFDMGDCLCDATAWRRWLWQLVARMGVRTAFDAFIEPWNREYLGDVHRGQRSFADALQDFLGSLGLSRAQCDEILASSQARRRELAADLRPLPGVRATMARLPKFGLTLGVLTDADVPGREIGEQLHQLRLSARFQTVLSSLDLGRTRPDPVCYLTALAAMGLPAEQVAFVGHSAEELAGARAVGMRTIACNFEPDAVADVYLSRFEELPNVLPMRSVRSSLEGVA